MLVLLHVSSALASIVISSVLVLRPTKRLFNLSYILIGATLASGTYLVISLRVKLLQICLSGLLYLAVVSVLLAGARWRQAVEHAKTTNQ